MSFIFRLISNIRFYAGMICMVILMWMATKTDIGAFRRVPALTISTTEKVNNTLHLKHKRISQQAIMLAYTHIRLWYNNNHFWADGSSIAELQGDLVSQAITATKNLQQVRTTDILQIRNTDQANGITSHMRYTSSILAQAETLFVPLTTLIQEQESRITSCTNQKSQADALYNQWLSNYNAGQVAQATTTAIEASNCISSATVQRNSLQGILNTLSNEITKTRAYLTLITSNQSLLSEYGDIVPTEIPTQLLQLQQDLKRL